MKKNFSVLLLLLILTSWAAAQLNQGIPRVKTENGTLEGVDESGIKTFKGVPFAAAPVGNLRWREPQPVANWTGIRKA
ncbi:MAG TPA: carboxylesterase family protein, partial [Chitinophagaceae bacterium]|nr:carboxylesterase family protein [Chitinophagaceae bacterium]